MGCGSSVVVQNGDIATLNSLRTTRRVSNVQTLRHFAAKNSQLISAEHHTNSTRISLVFDDSSLSSPKLARVANTLSNTDKFMSISKNRSEGNLEKRKTNNSSSLAVGGAHNNPRARSTSLLSENSVTPPKSPLSSRTELSAIDDSELSEFGEAVDTGLVVLGARDLANMIVWARGRIRKGGVRHLFVHGFVADGGIAAGEVAVGSTLFNLKDSSAVVVCNGGEIAHSHTDSMMLSKSVRGVVAPVLDIVRVQGRLPDFLFITYPEGLGAPVLNELRAVLTPQVLICGACNGGKAFFYSEKHNDIFEVGAQSLVVSAVWTYLRVSAVMTSGFILSSWSFPVDEVDDSARRVLRLGGAGALEKYRSALPGGAKALVHSDGRPDFSLSPLAQVIGYNEEGDPDISLIGVSTSLSPTLLEDNEHGKGKTNAKNDQTIVLSEQVTVGQELTMATGTVEDIFRRTDKVLGSFFDTEKRRAGALLGALMLCSTPIYLKKRSALSASSSLLFRKSTSNQMLFPSSRTLGIVGNCSGFFTSETCGPVHQQIQSGAAMASCLLFQMPLFAEEDGEFAGSFDNASTVPGSAKAHSLSEPRDDTSSSTIHDFSRPSNAFRRSHYPLVAAPSGRVTIIVSDIEASTMLWSTAKDAAQVAVARHNEISRRRMLIHRGYEFRTQGDSFHVAFQHDFDACAYAIGVLIDLWMEPWSTEVLRFSKARRAAYPGIGVRIGIEGGTEAEADVDADSKITTYSGAVPRQAEITSDKGHGFQILVGNATAAIIKPLLAYLPGDGAELVPCAEDSSFQFLVASAFNSLELPRSIRRRK